MGATAAAIPYIIAAIGTTAEYVNTRNTAQRQQNLLSEQLTSDQRFQDQANAKTDQLIAKQAKSTPDAERGRLLNSFQEAIRAKQAQALGPLNQVGSVSQAYKDSGSDAALGINDYGGAVSKLLANIDAPTYQRQDEAANDSRFQTALGQIGAFSRGTDNVYQMRLRNVQRNPWLDLLANGAKAYAGASAGGMGGASAGASSGYTWTIPDGSPGGGNP